MQTTIEHIRVVTQIIHERLHVHPMMATILKPTLTLEEYKNVLVAMASFYSALQSSLMASGLDCPVLTDDMKRLDDDLRVLNINIPQSRRPSYLTYAFTTYDDYLGVRYVIQGSHLGGQLIASHVRKTLGLQEQTGLSFYIGDAKRTAKSWATFKDMLEQTSDNPMRCATSAEAVFLALEAHLWQAWTDQLMRH